MVHTYQTTRCHNTEYVMVNRVLENRQSYIESPFEHADLPISVKITSVKPTLTLNKTGNGRIT